MSVPVVMILTLQLGNDRNNEQSALLPPAGIFCHGRSLILASVNLEKQLLSQCLVDVGIISWKANCLHLHIECHTRGHALLGMITKTKQNLRRLATY